MKSLLVSILSIFIISSCAHHHKEAGEHHHHGDAKSCKIRGDKGDAFDRHCAMSVSEGDMHVEGKKDFVIRHAGEIYYFSTKERMDKFQKNINKSISNARDNWSHDNRK